MGCAQKSESKRKRTFTDNAKKQQGGWRERDTEMDNTGDDVESSRCSLADGNPVSKPNKEVVDPEADAERDQRTVYVSGIPLRASREEVNLFFSSVCKVRNIDLMLDPSLRVPNAVGGVYSTHFLVSRTAQAGISLSYNDINDLDGSYCQVLNLA